MKRIFVLLAIVALVALSIGIAAADKPDPGENTRGRPSDPPCDADHGHPLENFIRQGRSDRCPTDDGGNGGDDGDNGDGNGGDGTGGDGTGGDGTGDGTSGPTCSEDNDGDGAPHSALAPENDETGLVSGIVHSVDRVGPIPPVTGDQSLVAEVNCALVAEIGL